MEEAVPVVRTTHTVLRGLVLRETETKEADKILTLLTAERGKVPVIARGARRRNSKLAAAAQTLAYGEWTLYRRGQWTYAAEGTVLELFQGLRADLETLALGCYFAELTETVSQEELPAEELLRHLLNGLYALSALHLPLKQVKAAFELKLLCLAGYEPLAEGCALCGRADPRDPVLELEEGILRCGTCGGSGGGRKAPLCPGSLAALRHIVYGNPRRLYSFRLEEEPLDRLARAAEAFLKVQLDRGFRTLDYYKSVSALDP